MSVAVIIAKLIGCALLGALVAGIGIVASPGLVGLAWLGVVLGAVLALIASEICREIAGLGGVAVYAFVAFSLTLWFTLAPPSNDILLLPVSIGVSTQTTMWPLVLLVAALLPVRGRSRLRSRSHRRLKSSLHSRSRPSPAPATPASASPAPVLPAASASPASSPSSHKTPLPAASPSPAPALPEPSTVPASPDCV